MILLLGSVSGPVLFNLSKTWLEGQSAPSASLQLIQNLVEWLTHREPVLLFSET